MRNPFRRGGAPPGDRQVRASRRDVVRFMLASLAALVVFALIGLYVQREIALRQEIDDVREDAMIVGNGIIEPNLTEAALAGPGPARDRFDALVRKEVLGGSIVRVKIWKPDGTIVYSDAPSIIGSRFPLHDDEAEALRTGDTVAEVTDLSQPDNVQERDFGKLLEVYLPVRSAEGEPYLFEMYERFSEVAAGGRRTWTGFAIPLLLLAVLLWLAQLPLAWSLSRRLRNTERERERLQTQAITISNMERRRIAADLHDGVVQQLAGTAYALEAAAASAETDPPDERRRALDEGIAGVRRVIRQLRSLIVEIHPPNLRSAGLAAAIADLATKLPAGDVDVRLDIADDAGLGVGAEELCFRAAQEGLRNVAAHARARSVAVRFDRQGDLAVLTVEDDGVGFDPASLAEFERQGHVGLSLLGELARDMGGDLHIDSSPGHGCRLRLEVPWT